MSIVRQHERSHAKGMAVFGGNPACGGPAGMEQEPVCPLLFPRNKLGGCCFDSEAHPLAHPHPVAPSRPERSYACALAPKSALQIPEEGREYPSSIPKGGFTEVE